MNLTDSDIEDFIRAWKQDFGEELTPDQARSEAERLLEFFYNQLVDGERPEE